MSNPIYQQMQVSNNLNMLSQLKNNPIQFLMSKGLKIPNDLARDPQKIVQYLLNTGQVNQQTYNQAMQIAQGFNK